jgi:hypothetical protein
MREWNDFGERLLAIANDDFLAGADLFEVPSQMVPQVRDIRTSHGVRLQYGHHSHICRNGPTDRLSIEVWTWLRTVVDMKDCLSADGIGRL